MMNFTLALGIFLAAHAILTRGPVRAKLVGLLGERGYLLGYSLLSTALMVWVIFAALAAPHIALWPAYAWTRWAALLLMPFALILWVAGALSPNPLSVAFRRGAYPADRPGILAVTRHPILWGFALWSGVHLLANGDLVSVILFGGLTLFSIAGMVRMDRKSRRTLGDADWQRLAAPTSILPFAAILAGRSRFPTDLQTAVAALLGLAIYGILLQGLHLVLFGADPFTGG